MPKPSETIPNICHTRTLQAHGGPGSALTLAFFDGVEVLEGFAEALLESKACIGASPHPPPGALSSLTFTLLLGGCSGGGKGGTASDSLEGVCGKESWSEFTPWFAAFSSIRLLLSTSATWWNKELLLKPLAGYSWGGKSWEIHLDG